MRYIKMTLMLCMLGLTSCGLLAQNPKPCNCEQVKTQLYQYTEDYAICLEDNGNLRDQLRNGPR